MERTNRFGVSGAVILIGLLVGVVFFGLRSGTVEVVYDDGPVVTAPESGEAIISDLSASGGFAPFGFRMVDRTHTVDVQFTTGPGCVDRLSGDEPWPTPYEECATATDVTGEVSGVGITQSGRSLVGVRFTVSGSCWDRLAEGMPWPPGVPECNG